MIICKFVKNLIMIKTLPFLALSILLLSYSCSSGGTFEPADMVDPMIGTDFTGNTYPGAQAPRGMVQLSPDNGLPGWDRIAGYYYPDSTIAGFSHTHLSGVGAGDMYDVSFMPVMLPVRTAAPPLGIHSRFSHDSEEASAGYYRVNLSDYDIDVELTAVSRAGIQRYTFHRSGPAAVILNLAKAMNWDSVTSANIRRPKPDELAGHRFSTGWARDQRVYFHTRFSEAPDSVRILPEGVAWCYFTAHPDKQITVSTALSGVSEDGAYKNLTVEVPKDDFDGYLKSVKGMWNRELSMVRVQTRDADKLKMFYTAMYHSLICPTIFCDVDGQYLGPDKKVHIGGVNTNYSTFSLWDTYRALHPLLSIISPRRNGDMALSLVEFYNQSGRLPVWNMWGGETDMMIGYHSVPVIVDAVLKEISVLDPNEALEACVATSNIDDYRGIGLYKDMGYVPYDVDDPYCQDNWSLSRTLEYAYDDYCIAKLAEFVGRDDLAREYRNRSLNYKNVYNPSSTWMQPRDSKGKWLPGFSPDDYTTYICESNGWQYFWSVQHDVDGLIDLIGGREKFVARLDSMFTYSSPDKDGLPIFSTGMIGQYAHGNEPSHHVAFLYNKVRQPWKAQRLVRQILTELYNPTPAGICGNDDCGQMSAWYMFGAMGFYPLDPVSGQYELVTPLFDEIQIRQLSGEVFTILAPGAESGKMPYIKSVKVNGEPYHKSYITHDMITGGATVELELTSNEGEIWY